MRRKFFAPIYLAMCLQGIGSPAVAQEAPSSLAQDDWDPKVDPLAYPVPDPAIYRNDEYEFSVKLPQGYAACLPVWPAHGVAIQLDPSHTCDNPRHEEPPYIDIDGYYNADFRMGSVRRFARANCRHYRKLRWLKRQLSDGRPVEGCLAINDDGSAEIMLTAIHGDIGFKVPWFEILIRLRTFEPRFTHDLRILEQIVRDLQVSTPWPEQSRQDRLTATRP